jgi:hypothetical protein
MLDALKQQPWPALFSRLWAKFFQRGSHNNSQERLSPDLLVLGVRQIHELDTAGIIAYLILFIGGRSHV